MEYTVCRRGNGQLSIQSHLVGRRPDGPRVKELAGTALPDATFASLEEAKADVRRREPTQSSVLVTDGLRTTWGESI